MAKGRPAVQSNTLPCCISLSAAVFRAVQRATALCVGDAAINLARSVRTVLPADAACFGKRGAAFRRAYFLAATTVLAARSFRHR